MAEPEPQWSVVSHKPTKSRPTSNAKSRTTSNDQSLIGACLYTSSINVKENSELIGAPIILRGGPELPEATTNSRGGLIKLTPAMKQEMNAHTTKMQSEFSLMSQSEWPAVHSDNSPRATTNQSSSGKSWSNALKAPPRVKNRSEPASNKIAESNSDEEKETSKKKKKKKKKPTEGLITDKQPLMLELGSLFDNLTVEKGKKMLFSTGSSPTVIKTTPTSIQRTNHTGDKSRVGNILDSSAPVIRKGKDREEPKKRRPTPLRKVINKEKEQRKSSNQNEEPTLEVKIIVHSSKESDIPVVLVEEMTSLDINDEMADQEHVRVSLDLSDTVLDKTDEIDPPICLDDGDGDQEDEGLHCGSEGSDIEEVEPDVKPHPIAAKPSKPGHNRKFREYCTHVVTDDINECAAMLLSELVRFQDRQFLKDPLKARVRKRYVCGMREVLKHLKSKRVKCLIVAPNMDRIQSEGGIDDVIGQILSLAEVQELPMIFAMSRRRLAVTVKKSHKVGCVGIFRHEGAESHYKKLLELVEEARELYKTKMAALTQLQVINGSDDGNGTGVQNGGNPWNVFFPNGQSPTSHSYINSRDHVISEPGHVTNSEFNVLAKEFVPSFNINAPEFKPQSF